MRSLENVSYVSTRGKGDVDYCGLRRLALQSPPLNTPPFTSVGVRERRTGGRIEIYTLDPIPQKELSLAALGPGGRHLRLQQWECSL